VNCSQSIEKSVCMRKGMESGGGKREVVHECQRTRRVSVAGAQLVGLCFSGAAGEKKKKASSDV
jgi:hypothetical protein